MERRRWSGEGQEEGGPLPLVGVGRPPSRGEVAAPSGSWKGGGPPLLPHSHWCWDSAVCFVWG